MQLFLLFLFFTLLVVCSNMLFAMEKINLRGIELHIIDAETGNPIPDINVYYYLRKTKQRIVDYDFAVIAKKKFVTNENGIIYIKPRVIKLRQRHRLYGENIYINIDVKSFRLFIDKFYYLSFYFLLTSSSREKIFFPNEEYYPAVVINFNNSPDGYTIIQETKDLKVKNDQALSDLTEENDIKITIELRRR